MRTVFVHEAVLALAADADAGAPGAAITARLCGSWEHAGACPLAPHHTGVSGTGRDVELRVVFAAEPGQAQAVRDLIVAALRAGQLTGPDGRASSWRLMRHGRATLRSEEQGLATRLATSN